MSMEPDFLNKLFILMNMLTFFSTLSHYLDGLTPACVKIKLVYFCFLIES